MRCDADGTVLRLFTLDERGELVGTPHVFRGHRGAVRRLDLSPDGRFALGGLLAGPYSVTAAAQGYRALQPAREVVEALAAHNVLAAHGDFYAVRAMESLGFDRAHGAVRLSFVHYTSAEDIDRLLTILDEVL